MKRISALLSLLLVWGCARPSTETTETIVLDLVDRFDDAAAFSETGRIDIGTPQARPHLRLDSAAARAEKEPTSPYLAALDPEQRAAAQAKKNDKDDAKRPPTP